MIERPLALALFLFTALVASWLVRQWTPHRHRIRTVIINPISVCIAIALHLVWTVGLYMEPSAINATGLHTMLTIAHSPRTAAIIFGMVAFLACMGLFVRRRWLSVCLLLPQQAALWVSVVGAVSAMMLGEFADGIQRAHWFLIVDQVPIVLIALGHTMALLTLAESDRGG